MVLLSSGYNNGSAGRLYVLNAKGNGSGKAVVISEIATSAPNDNGLAQISGLALDNQKTIPPNMFMAAICWAIYGNLI